MNDTVCQCGHWFEEHGPECAGCDAGGHLDCTAFVFDPAENTPEAIASRGGDPAYWPQHVKDAAAGVTERTAMMDTTRRDYHRWMYAGTPQAAIDAVARILADDGREHGETWTLVDAVAVPSGHTVMTAPGDTAYQYRVSGNVSKAPLPGPAERVYDFDRERLFRRSVCGCGNPEPHEVHWEPRRPW